MSSEPLIKNPFKGLRPFKQEEQEELFGRDRDLILMKDRILSSRTTLLFAGSGVGKTSFLNAKVIPALSERYCVVSHNRWTGAEEKSDAGIWDDYRPFRIWPPGAFVRWFKEWLVQPAWVRQRKKEWAVGNTANRSNDDSASDETESPQRKIAKAVQNVISQSLRPGNKRRLSRVLSIFKKRSDTSTPQTPCILILDQFEEIFQYHAYEPYFQDFISDLCKVINDETYQVRVVFSMREEFLGELSVFDNRILDLFNNYYRLRYPEKDEAKYIITQTCKLVDVEPVPENLDELVDDLATIENSFEAGAVTGEVSKTVRLVRRNFVPPPYLQIVCDTLWKEQFDNPVPNVTATNNGDTAEQKPVRFLENYKTGSENTVNGDESGARRAVREFCEAKLSQPFLKKWEQNVAARAFGFLVTKQGAKMAYELRSLASHMDEQVWPVKHTLQKLSLPDARILRESRGPEGSYWFELYHDMYAGVVDRWKRRYSKEQRRRQQRQAVVYAILIAFLILVPLAVFNWVVYPRQYRKTIFEFSYSLDTTDIKNHRLYTGAVLAYTNLSETWGYHGEAGVLWAEVWARRAELFEAKEQREEALLCLLQAAQLAKGDFSAEKYLAQANNLLAGNEEAIKETYCHDCQAARLSPDAKYVLTITKDGNVDIWTSGRKDYLTTVCADCTQAQFSPDSKLVLTVRPITEFPGRRGTSENRTGSLGPEPTPTPSDSKKILGWEIRITPNESASQPSLVSFVIKKDLASLTSLAKAREEDSTARPTPANVVDPSFRLKSFAKTPAGYLVAGFMQGRLSIWQQDGTQLVQSVPVQGVKTAGTVWFGPAANFSPDGKFLLVVGSENALWAVSNSGLTPVTKIDLLPGHIPAFSPDGKYLVGVNRKAELKVWELEGQTEVLTIPSANEIARIDFARASNKFAASDRGGSITIWDCDTKQKISTVTGTVVARPVFLENSARTLVQWVRGYSHLKFEKRAVDKGSKIGELGVDLTEPVAFVDSDGDSLMLLADSTVRLWDIPVPKETPWLVRISKGEDSREELSEDGNTILMASTADLTTGPTTFHLLDVNQQQEIFPEVKATTYQRYQLSPDGNHLIIQVNDKTIDLYDRTKPPQSKITLTFDKSPTATAFSSDGRYFAVTTQDKQLSLFDSTTGGKQWQLPTGVAVSSIVFTHDNKHLLVSPKRSLIESVNPFEEFDQTSNTVEAWSVATGNRVEFKLEGKEPVQAISLSNERVAMFQNQKIIVFNLEDASPVKAFDYGQDLATLAISPDGKFVVTGDQKGLIQLWNTDSESFEGHTSVASVPHRIVFGADGTSFIVITRQWIHRIEIFKNASYIVDNVLKKGAALDYANGIFTGENGATSVRWLPANSTTNGSPNEYVRWLRGTELFDASFDRGPRKQILTGDPDKLWDIWPSKLGFNVVATGLLEKKTPYRNPSAAYVSTPASR